MLQSQLQALSEGSWLYCWAGKLLDSEHASIRADLVRLRGFYRSGPDMWIYREIPPYRPAAVSNAPSKNPDAHRLIFSGKPLLVIRNGARKGRHAYTEDLYRTEEVSRIDIEASFTSKNMLDVDDRTVSHSLEICETMFESYEAAGGRVLKASSVFVPTFLLSSKKTAQNVYKRPTQSERWTEAEPTEYNGFVLRDANVWYGQGVWCVDPGDLGHWRVKTGSDLTVKFVGYEVDVHGSND